MHHCVSRFSFKKIDNNNLILRKFFLKKLGFCVFVFVVVSVHLRVEETMSTDERFAEMALAIQQLTHTVARMAMNQQERVAPVPHHDRNTEDRTMKIDVTEFGGTTHNPEDYMEWEAELERYFEFKDTPEEQKYKLAKIKLNKLAAIWLDGVQKQRGRENRERINTWVKLKKHLRRKYVPASYKQQLYVQWSTLRQDNRTVADYIQQWEKLAVLCDINEPEEMKIGKFIGGLREDLREKLEVLQPLTFDIACTSALTYEKYSRKQHPSTQSAKQTFPKTNLVNSNLGNISLNTNASSKGTHTAAPSRPKENPNAPLKDVVCFKCHGHGHYRNECPNARAFTNLEWTEINSRERAPRAMLVAKDGEEQLILPHPPADEPEGSYMLTDLGTLRRTHPEDPESSESEGEKAEQIYPEEGHYQLLIRRNFHATPKGKPMDQRESVFSTKCRIQNQVCSLVIDGGSEVNCVSHKLVHDMKLNTKNHPNPYKLRWLDPRAEGYVKRQCLVNFAIGSYSDEVLCDVVEMNVCHILLGRPWQHAKHSMHNGFTNVYTIKHNGKLKELIPLPPRTLKPTPVEHNKTSNAVTKVENCTEVQHEQKSLHLLMKETKEDQNQQPIQALITHETAAVDLELLNPMTNCATELNKLHHESSTILCDMVSFLFIEDTIVDSYSCCRYVADNQQILQPKDTTTRDTKHAGLQEGTLMEEPLNLLHNETSRTFHLDELKEHENNAELRTILLKERGIDAIMTRPQTNNKQEHNCIMKPIEHPCATPEKCIDLGLNKEDQLQSGLRINLEAREEQEETQGSLQSKSRLNRRLCPNPRTKAHQPAWQPTLQASKRIACCVFEHGISKDVIFVHERLSQDSEASRWVLTEDTGLASRSLARLVFDNG